MGLVLVPIGGYFPAELVSIGPGCDWEDGAGRGRHPEPRSSRPTATSPLRHAVFAPLLPSYDPARGHSAVTALRAGPGWAGPGALLKSEQRDHSAPLPAHSPNGKLVKGR